MSSLSLPHPLTPDAFDPDAVRAHIADALGAIDAYPDPAVWIYRATSDQVHAQLDRALLRRAAGEDLPLLGLTVAVKDNIDVLGMPTTAACPDFAYAPQRSATVVKRLETAGAIVLGKTNLDQFATGLVGTRSPYGACRNVFDPRYISGGSSSGSAVAVAAALVDFALGTDTAGSGRVPAAFNNIVGLKPTKGLLSTTGVVPACRSLDCVSIFARTVDMTERAFHVARGFDPEDVYARQPEDFPPRRPRAASGAFRFGILTDGDLEFFGDPDADWLYHAAVRNAEAIGGTPVPVDFAPFREAARLLYDGPWVAERLAAIHGFLDRRPDALLPVTRQIITGAHKYSAADAYLAEYRLRALRRTTAAQLRDIDTLLLPTAPTIYTIDAVSSDPITLNRNLGYYTNFVNLLDLCALAIPAGFTPTGLPFGVTFMAPAGDDDYLVALARCFLAEAAPPPREQVCPPPRPGADPEDGALDVTTTPPIGGPH
jgi:allophanate hydrolase